MQQKLDSLCEQVSTMKEQPENAEEFSFVKSDEFDSSNDMQSKGRKMSSCGCCFCEEHQYLPNAMVNVLVQKDSINKSSGGDKTFKFKMPHTYTSEQERRMSDYPIGPQVSHLLQITRTMQWRPLRPNDQKKCTFPRNASLYLFSKSLSISKLKSTTITTGSVTVIEKKFITITRSET